MLSCPRTSNLDVIFSYQSAQEGLLRRLRRALSQLGFTSFDGTQVPGGRDWRATYFEKLEAALCFVPIVCSKYLQSLPCSEEAFAANARGIPVLQVLQDPAGCSALFDSKKNGHGVSDDRDRRLEAFSGLGYGRRSEQCAATVPTAGAFQDDFVGNLLSLANELSSNLPFDASLHVVIAYAKPDQEFALLLAARLGMHMNVVAINGEETEDQTGHDWAQHCSARSVLVPVLSANFLNASGGAPLRVMGMADVKLMSFCPVLHDCDGFSATVNEPSFKAPYILSILNTSNRVPANRNFSDNFTDHLQQLLEAVCILQNIDRSDTNASVSRRLPKYKSLLAHPAASFPAQGSFMDNFEVNMQQLQEFLRGKGNLGSTAEVILLHATANHEAALRLQQGLAALGIAIVVECCSIEWYATIAL